MTFNNEQTLFFLYNKTKIFQNVICYNFDIMH